MTTTEAPYSLTWKLGTDSYLAPLFTVRGSDGDSFRQNLADIIGEEAMYALLQKAAVYASNDGGMNKAVANVQQGFPGAQPVAQPAAPPAAPQWPQQPQAQAPQGWGAAAPPQAPPQQWPQQPQAAPAGPPPGGSPMCPHGPMVWKSARDDSWKGYFCALPKGTQGACKPQYIR